MTVDNQRWILTYRRDKEAAKAQYEFFGLKSEAEAVKSKLADTCLFVDLEVRHNPGLVSLLMSYDY